MFSFSRNIVFIAACLGLWSCGQRISSPSSFKYDPNNATTCPSASETDKYVEVPVFPDLRLSAKITNIPGLNLHQEAVESPEWKNKKLRVYFELDRPFDPAKKLFIFLNGGPGGDHSVMHALKAIFPEVFESYNVIALDHRGVGCSKPLFPGDLPAESMLMRFAAYDIEAIRKSFGDDHREITVWGGSYGTMLGQTYALLYPDHLNHLILAAAFSAADDFNDAQRKYPSLAVTTVPGVEEKFKLLEAKDSDLAKRFLTWSVRKFYKYKGRVKEIPETLSKVLELLEKNQRSEAFTLVAPDRWVLQWMTRSIACIEIFRAEALHADEFQMFPYNFSTCSEFEGTYEYFNYTDALKNIGARTLLLSGFYDHVTPFEAMQRMSKKIPNNYFHVDMHLGHDVQRSKPLCLGPLVNAFLSNAPNEQLQQLSLVKDCRTPPTIE